MSEMLQYLPQQDQQQNEQQLQQQQDDDYLITDFKPMNKYAKNVQLNSRKTSSEKQRARFDSTSTSSMSSSSDNQLDCRFEARILSDVIQVKTSFLSTSTANSNFQSLLIQAPYSIALAISQNNDMDDFVCCEIIEMPLDDNKTIDSLIYDIAEQFNHKLNSRLTQMYPSIDIPMNLLTIQPYSIMEGHIEISGVSKSNKPKGCSFDMNQIFKNMKYKKQSLCLKITDSSVYNSLVLKLANNTQRPNAINNINKKSKYDIQNPIIEIDDDIASVRLASCASHYRDSLNHIQSVFENSNNNQNNTSYNQQSLSRQRLDSSNSSSFSSRNASDLVTSKHYHSQQAAVAQKNSFSIKPVKKSLWSKIFKCGINCE